MSNEDFSLNIQGLEEVNKMLDSLPDEISDKILLDLAMKSGQIAKKELQNAAPEGVSTKKSGNAIKDNVLVRKSDSGSGVNIGFAKKVFYVKFIENGTKVRFTKNKANRGSMSRKPFVQKAHDTATPKIIEFFSSNFLSMIDKAIKKQLKKLVK